MNTNDTYYPDLITRYFSGEATPEEISGLSEWIRSDPEHATLFDEFRKTWVGVMVDQIDQQIDPEKEWSLLKAKLPGIRPEKVAGQRPGFVGRTEAKKTPVSKRTPDVASPKKPAWKILSRPKGTRQDSKPRTKQPGPYNPKPTTQNLQPATQNLQPATQNLQPATLREPKIVQMTNTRIPLQVILIRASLIAAIILVLLIPTWVGYRYFTRTEVISLTASGEILDAVLPDGSVVTLNAYTSLTYTEQFGKTNREIILSGEGYFEVSRDSLLPFVVECGSTRLEVLGTSFYVHAEQAAGTMEVVLVEGKVSVFFEDARSTGKTITPGEKAELNPSDQRIVISSNEDPNFLAWKTHHLIFIDERLDMIVNTLNKVYQADISLTNETLASCRLTATFHKQSLESVLNVILTTLDLQAETTQSGIVLYGNGCN